MDSVAGVGGMGWGGSGGMGLVCWRAVVGNWWAEGFRFRW